MATEDEILNEREQDVQQSTPTYAQRSEARSNSVSLPDTTGETSSQFQQRTGATAPMEGESFVEAQSRGREQRLASRPDFNQPFRTDQRGTRTGIATVTGEQGQVATLTDSRIAQGIQGQTVSDQEYQDTLNLNPNRLSRSGRQRRQDIISEYRRNKNFENSTVGRNVDFSALRQSLAQMRRGLFGQKEVDRQLNEFYGQQGIDMGVPKAQTTSDTSEANQPSDVANAALESDIDIPAQDNTVAFNDYTSELLDFTSESY